METNNIDLKIEDSTRHPSVFYIDSAELDLWLHHSHDSFYYRSHHNHVPLLLDVRTPDEFNVSHLKRAKRIEPFTPDLSGLSAEYPLNTAIVAYTDMEHRAYEMRTRLLQAGFKEVYILYSGIFKWINEGRQVYDNEGNEVSVVHPVDAKNARFLVQEKHIPEHYTPVFVAQHETSSATH